MPKRSAEALMVPEATPMSYYGRPILKAPTWDWTIASYLFTGGLAAGASLAGAGARVSGDRRLASGATAVSISAVAASGIFLVYDLGRPERFYNMLRVFKPTSPMSVGTYIFSAFSAVTGLAVAADVGEKVGLLPPSVSGPASAAAQLGAAAIAPALATYTGVLIADTAVPAWKEAGTQLPWLFAGSAAAAGGGAVAVVDALLGGGGRGSGGRGAGVRGAGAGAGARRLAVAGAVAELAMGEAMERSLRAVTTGDEAHPDLSAPFHEGRTGALMRAAKVATAAGAAVTAVGGRRRGLRAVGGLALLAGSALTRFAIFEAGRDTAADPVYTVGPQKARLAARASLVQGLPST